MRFVSRFSADPRRRRRALVGLAVALAAMLLALPSMASAAAFTVRLHAASHAPKANVNFPLTITATRGATKLSGRFHYQFLFQGQVVSTQPGHSFSRGRYVDKLLFPSRAVGHPLTVRCVVTTKFGTASANWAVSVRK